MSKSKRGRKAKKKYFGEEQEEAVVEFLSLGELVQGENDMIWVGTREEEQKRDEIYRKYLRAPLDKMIESIIRTYKLYSRDYSFEDLHSDTLSFLMIKFHKFKPEKGKKSYSYFGTVCKHYLLGQVMRGDKKIKTLIPYEDISSSIEERDDLTYRIDDDDINLSALFSDICNSIHQELEKDDLSDNEIKVGSALVKILEDWETLFSNIGGNKYNKNLILLYMREMTSLTTKDIRNAMKRYKTMYKFIKNQSI